MKELPPSPLTVSTVVDRDVWLMKRREVLKKEKALTHARDAVTAELRALPWLRVEKEYTFDTRSEKKTLADLFDGRSQLVIYSFMLGPNSKDGCHGCSFFADHFGSLRYHLPQRDVAFKVVCRAPLSEIESYRKRMGWDFDWVSSAPCDFTKDMHEISDLVTGVPTPVDMKMEHAGIAIFARSGEEVYQTLDINNRGVEVLSSTYGLLDFVPKGRDERGDKEMSWIKRHDEYAENTKVAGDCMCARN